MKITAILDGKERELEIKQVDEHRFEVFVDGQAHGVDARRCASDQVSILMDNRSYDISYSLDGDSIELQFWNQYFDIEILDERRLRMRRVRSQLDQKGPERIKSAMPGKVVKVMVEEGSVVESGTGIVIIEAMKMENEIQCRRSGIVKIIHVEVGQAIERGALLVEIDPQ